MKKGIYFILIAIIFMAFACKKETEVLSFYRPSNPQNFKTIKGDELYAFAANDTVLIVADYYMKVMGQIKTYGSEIVAYGFCWHTSNKNPVIGVDTLRTTSSNPLPINDTLSFTMALTRLSPNTPYYIRSYVVTLDDSGDSIFWYNPVVLEKMTRDAIDEWREQTGELNKPTSLVFDAVAFNYGDTIFFGTGNFGKGFLSDAMFMYDPQTSSWKAIAPVPRTSSPYNESQLTDATGFAITFQDISPDGIPTPGIKKFMYVGLGDFRGNDLGPDKSKTLQIYDLVADEWTSEQTAPFAGGIRSGAVSFVIGQCAYVGTGSNSAATGDWYVYQPALDRDGVIGTEPWQALLTKPGTKNRTGAIAFTMNGRGYFGLGMDEAGNFLTDFWEFRPNQGNPPDPTKGTWSPRRPFPGTARANASAFAIGDQGYIATGDNFKPNIPGNKIDLQSDPPNFNGEMFDDLWRYDPFNDKWWPQADYTTDKISNSIGKKVTHAVGFSSPKNKVGFVGYGIVPEDPISSPQSDLWKYLPYVSK